jgi:NAD-dependent SIR2 family protein deacetylase
MTKKKLLITVGAGASVDFDMPSVSGVDELFDQVAGKTYPLIGDQTSNLYRYCRDVINLYYGGSSKPKLRKWANF